MGHGAERSEPKGKVTLPTSSQGGDTERRHPPAPGLGSKQGPGPDVAVEALKEAGASSRGFWHQMGHPGRVVSRNGVTLVSKQDGNSQPGL